MTDLATTLTKLRRGAGRQVFKHADVPVGADRLHDLAIGDGNPGQLRARTFVPEGLGRGAALVVVLHGCTQTASAYDHGAGWSKLAEEEGFAVLFPEQRQTNNPNLCFNWFSPIDQRRGSGEALSIRTMVAAMVAAYGIDEHRIFVTGLSAGGAMTSIMLATYPDVFAGGAVIAGLPYGGVATVGEAMARMRGNGHPSPDQLVALVRAASDHRGPWPTLSVWHGAADSVVDPFNADCIVTQWQALHGVEAQSPASERVVGRLRRQWRDRNGRLVIEQWTIDGMGHGTPIAAGGDHGCGTAGPYMLETGISSTRHIAQSWGLLATVGTSKLRPVAPVMPHPEPIAATMAPGRFQGNDVEAVINDALRAAGLMR